MLQIWRRLSRRAGAKYGRGGIEACVEIVLLNAAARHLLSLVSYHFAQKKDRCLAETVCMLETVPPCSWIAA